jgi:hypothetical protein
LPRQRKDPSITDDEVPDRVIHLEAAVYEICAGGFCERARRACVLSEAKERHQSQSISAKFARSRLAVGALLDWLPFQIIVGVILVVNFALEVCKTQAQGILFDYLGHPTQIAAIKLGKFRLSFLGNLLAGCANIYLAPGAALTPWLLQWLFSRPR